MRIISPHCGAEPDSASGGEVFERNLLRSLAEAGDEVHLLLARHKTVPPGVVAHVGTLGRGLRWWVAWAAWVPAILACWRRCGPADLLRAHSIRFTGPACLLARRIGRLRVPVVVHVHHLDPSPLNRLLELRVLRAADLVVTDSAFARGQLVALGCPPGKIRVVHSGIGDQYRPRPVLGRSYPFRVLACGPLIPRKDPLFALRVMALLRQQGLGNAVRLVWIGDGPLRARVESEITRLGLSDMVVVPPRVSESIKLAMVQLADAFLHPATVEGFALAPQEAMACGVPVVMRRAASAEEMVEDGVDGVLVDDEGHAARVIAALIEEPAWREALGVAAQSTAEARFRWSHTAQGVRAAYAEAVQASRPPPHGFA